MNYIGKKILVKRGLFANNEGVIENTFRYKGRDIYTVAIFKGKNITEKYITTVENNEFEII